MAQQHTLLNGLGFILLTSQECFRIDRTAAGNFEAVSHERDANVLLWLMTKKVKTSWEPFHIQECRAQLEKECET